MPRLLQLALLAAAALLLSCDDGKDPGEPPPPPSTPGWLSVTGITQTTVTLRWDDRSTNEDGFYIYIVVGTDWTKRDTTEPDIEEFTVANLEAAHDYMFRVTAFNENGESDPTNEVPATTTSPPALNPPTNVAAEALAENLVRVTWTDRGTQDSFVIQRREPVSAWARAGAAGDNVVLFYDSTVSPLTTYLYRVGASAYGNTAWSADSAQVQTPAPGVPRAPDSLSTEVIVGTGVALTWADRSTNETRFDISRTVIEGLIDCVASVQADSELFFDSLGEARDFYYYRVRAASEAGTSAWSATAGADYRLCSSGVIPLCLNNWWDYEVDTTGGPRDIRREVRDVAFPGGTDYYLIVQTPAAGGDGDSLYYLRNQQGLSCFTLPYPLPATPVPECLFRYPTGEVGSHYTVQGDCVLVLVSTPGITVVIGGTTYENVVAYQRFYDDQHRVQIWVKPNDVGIIREDEYTGPVSQPVLAARRDLTAYFVQN